MYSLFTTNIHAGDVDVGQQRCDVSLVALSCHSLYHLPQCKVTQVGVSVSWPWTKLCTWKFCAVSTKTLHSQIQFLLSTRHTNDRLMIQRLQIWYPAVAADLTFYVGSYSVTIPPPPPPVTAVAHKRPQSFCHKCRWQVTPKHACTFDLINSQWAD